MRLQSTIVSYAAAAVLLTGTLVGQQIHDTDDTTGGSAAVISSSDAKMASSDEFVAMTHAERLSYYLRSLVGPEAFIFAGAEAGINQLDNKPKEWRQGAEGYGKRYGSKFGEHVIDATVSNALALALHEDNRYFKSGRRAWRG